VGWYKKNRRQLAHTNTRINNDAPIPSTEAPLTTPPELTAPSDGEAVDCDCTTTVNVLGLADTAPTLVVLRVVVVPVALATKLTADVLGATLDTCALATTLELAVTVAGTLAPLTTPVDDPGEEDANPHSSSKNSRMRRTSAGEQTGRAHCAVVGTNDVELQRHLMSSKLEQWFSLAAP